MFDPTDPDNTPITILVTQGEWAAVDAITPRNIELARMLTDLGGINESVPPGTYKFNVLLQDGQLISTLDPA